MIAFHNGRDLASTVYGPLNFPIERIRYRRLIPDVAAKA